MFIIISYDVNEKRCKKFNKLLKNYLFHVANSVFHGEITESKYKPIIVDRCIFTCINKRITYKELIKRDCIELKKYVCNKKEELDFYQSRW